MQRDIGRMLAEVGHSRVLSANEEVLAVVNAVMERVDLHNRYRQ